MTKPVNDYRFEVVLTLRSPVMSAGVDAASLGIDASPLLTDKAGQRYPILPGSLIKGNLKHSWKKLCEISSSGSWMSDQQIQYWLGSEADQKNNAPSRAKLRESDQWIAEIPAMAGQTRYRIKLEEETGKVERGALQQIEIPHPVGKEVNYVGWFECTCTETVAQQLYGYLKQGLAFVPSLGAFKGIGFGVIKKVEITPPQLVEHRHQITDCGGDVFGMSLMLDRPLSLNHALNQVGNRFEPIDFIPGAAIKGAIASRIAQFDDQSRWPSLLGQLDKIRFTHAKTELRREVTRRSVPVPMNLYVHKQQAVVSAGLITPEVSLPESGHIAFQPDWKSTEWSAVNNLFQSDFEQPPVHTLRVRTAIKEGAGIADDGRLFSSEVIEADQHQWLCDVSLTAVPGMERDQVRRELIDLLSYGINSLGKLDACTVDIRLKAGRWPTTIPESPVNKTRVCLLLMSDARLFPDKGLDLSGTNGGDELHRYYFECWSSLSGGLLELDEFYARQKLVGGEYYRRRFKQLEKAYNPWLVTAAGSIFYFQTSDVDACAKLLETWGHSGVRVLPELSDKWDENPMVPANGYGEISVNPIFDTQAIEEALNHG
ncbi:RAMP superfamily CRISPR-associated protein [Leucothrix mucor]|uniref:RAMP superfamily CRISPR-associated protein n=1 Tax=Leucothrix mucor TaxID=45248 RepID=UPI0003B69A41|nr:RAMP superfamily CRISPR-associated protein [Leucothrix mucor]